MNTRLYVEIAEGTLKYFLRNRKLYRFTYPLNFLAKDQDNDKLLEKGIDKSIEKEIRTLFFIVYRMLKLNNIFKKNQNYYKSCVKNDIEYFFYRYRIIIDIIDKHLIKAVDFERKKGFLEIYNRDEFEQLRNARNMLTHQGLRTQIFFTNENKNISFQMYEPGSLDNIIYLPKCFKDPCGNEIYLIDVYISWMMIIMLEFLDGCFKKISEKRLDGNDIDKEFNKGIPYFDRFYNNNLSTIQFWTNDYLFVKKLINNFIVFMKKHSGWQNGNCT
jgi:hypothetical protein